MINEAPLVGRILTGICARWWRYFLTVVISANLKQQNARDVIYASLLFLFFFSPMVFVGSVYYNHVLPPTPNMLQHK